MIEGALTIKLSLSLASSTAAHQAVCCSSCFLTPSAAAATTQSAPIKKKRKENNFLRALQDWMEVEVSNPLFDTPSCGCWDLTVLAEICN